MTKPTKTSEQNLIIYCESFLNVIVVIKAEMSSV